MKYNVDTVRESGWYNKKEWLAVRDYVRQRDKMTCVRCGAFGAKKYEVDHIIELTWENLDVWEIALNPDNLQLLCKSCHNKKTGDLDEVLNWSPKGEHNSMEFWQKVIKKLLCTRYVDLYPIFDRKTGDLADLLLTNDGKEYKPEELVRLVSPFYINEDTSILDNALASIQTKLEQGKLRGLLKINAFLDIDNTQEYREKALTTIKNMQEGSSYNGLTPVDNKTEIVELKKDYSVLNKDEIDLIKSELLTGYFMNENILLGTATQEQQIYFYNSTIIPLLIQLEKELTYKLISTGRRRINKDNLYYERIIVDNQLFKFATLKELIDLYHENINAPIFTVNQLLVKMGEQPIEGGDIYITNLNAVAVKSLSDLQGSRKDVTSTDETNNQ